MSQEIDRSFAVVKMRLPYVDRRSLSQAWFSALALAGDGHAAAQSHRLPSTAPAPSRTVADSLNPARTPAMRERAVVRGAAPVREARSNAAGNEVFVRRYRSSAAQLAAARTSFARGRSYPPFGTSLSLGGDGGRVQLVLRRDGETLHVVALCAAGSVDVVRRALACAQARLRLRGETLRAAVHASAVRA